MTKKKRRIYLIAGALSVAVIFAVVVYAATSTKYSADTLNTITTGGVHIRLNETTLVDAATGKPVVIDPVTGAAADGTITTSTVSFPAIADTVFYDKSTGAMLPVDAATGKQYLTDGAGNVILVEKDALTGGWTLTDKASSTVLTDAATIAALSAAIDEKMIEAAVFPASGGITGVLPGQAYAKNVSVTNTGSQSAWVRIKAEKEYWKSGSKVTSVSVPTETRTYDATNDKWTVTAGTSDKALDANNIDLLGLNAADWTLSGGYYYYNTQLLAGKTTSSLFTGVQMSGTMGTEYSGLEARVNVTAEATQAKNNGTSATAATGWPS